MASPVVVSRIQNRRGTQAQFDALYPVGYTGIGGYGSLPGFNATNFPDVLLPGEVAFCTDTRRFFIGNINAEYTEVGVASAAAPKYQYFSATAAQTIFNTTIPTIANTINNSYLQIFVNGVKQIEGLTKNYTVTGANQITFTTGLILSDEVEMYSFT
jgi:hypothetical protein